MIHDCKHFSTLPFWGPDYLKLEFNNALRKIQKKYLSRIYGKPSILQRSGELPEWTYNTTERTAITHYLKNQVLTIKSLLCKPFYYEDSGVNIEIEFDDRACISIRRHCHGQELTCQNFVTFSACDFWLKPAKVSKFAVHGPLARESRAKLEMLKTVKTNFQSQQTFTVLQKEFSNTYTAHCVTAMLPKNYTYLCDWTKAETALWQPTFWRQKELRDKSTFICTSFTHHTTLGDLEFPS